MSLPLISHSDDLSRLVAAGYAIEISDDDHLIVHHVPYVTEDGEVDYGKIVCPVVVEGDHTGPVSTHQVWFAGRTPCSPGGTRLESLISGESVQVKGGVTVNFDFSHMPIRDGSKVQYSDYFEKIDAYVRLLTGIASEIDPTATAKIGVGPIESAGGVFKFRTSATSDAGISDLDPKLSIDKVAIVGTGGTGSYLLDFLSKTPIVEIHLFDRDHLLNRNAMRAPGPVSVDELVAAPRKVDFFAERYSTMRHGVIPHPVAISGSNAEELAEMSFVFLAMDGGPEEREIAERLIAWRIPFISVGMGIRRHDDSLRGTIRTTASSPEAPVDLSHLGGSLGEFNDYDRNIQIAELNALNAALAVMKFKRMLGYYADDVQEQESRFKLQSNKCLNETTSE